MGVYMQNNVIDILHEHVQLIHYSLHSFTEHSFKNNVGIALTTQSGKNWKISVTKQYTVCITKVNTQYLYANIIIIKHTETKIC